jgi:hypothetical protein
MMALRVPSLLLLLVGETTALLIGPNATGPHRSLWDQVRLHAACAASSLVHHGTLINRPV